MSHNNTPPKKKKQSYFIPQAIDGEGDLFTAIADLGGIRPRLKNQPENGIYDGYREAIGEGETRFLVWGTGLAPDVLRETLNNNFGYSFESCNELYEAIQRTFEERQAKRLFHRANAERRNGMKVLKQPESEPENEIETFSQELAEAAERLREEAANEYAGRQGMMGPKNSAGSVDGSPLFGDSQAKLF